MISEQQAKILAFPYCENYDAIICDGAVRSGKTSIMMWAFVKWAMDNFSGQRLGICGKTVDSTIKNVINPFRMMTLAQEYYSIKWRRGDHVLEIETADGAKKNYFEVFGGKDEASQDLIQGRTLAGVLLDEVALMPASFVNQALARCSVEGSRFWFNCNPASPQHWFYTQWIQQAKERHALYLHFSLEDNPSLSEAMLERYNNMYTGVFYERYIRGNWVSAEGLIYDMFDKGRHVVSDYETQGDYFVSADFGIQNATVWLLWRKAKEGEAWACVDEWYYSGRESRKQKTVESLVKGLLSILKEDEDGVLIYPKQVIVDPSATALIVELRKQGFHVIPARNEVLDGIEDVTTLLAQDKLRFDPRCKNTIREFGLYAWDIKAADRGEDRPVKDNDHCMDAVRYFVKTRHLVERHKTFRPPVTRNAVLAQ